MEVNSKLKYLAAIREEIANLEKEQDKLYSIALKTAKIKDSDEISDYMLDRGELPENTNEANYEPCREN